MADHALNSDMLSPSNQEEADARIFLHAVHAATCGAHKLMIKTVDTDVVVLAIDIFQQLGLSEFWRNAKFMSNAMCNGLTFFHAVSGCDTCSAFSGQGKKNAFSAWKSLHDLPVSPMSPLK